MRETGRAFLWILPRFLVIDMGSMWFFPEMHESWVGSSVWAVALYLVLRWVLWPRYGEKEPP